MSLTNKIKTITCDYYSNYNNTRFEELYSYYEGDAERENLIYRKLYVFDENRKLLHTSEIEHPPKYILRKDDTEEIEAAKKLFIDMFNKI